ncbi:MAG: vanadium-dependent haloperoxidase [Saprospiraceae bacterium]|nr:vanadium-dependent haloperoxidase [Saprospiraceae bacterium]
MKKVFPFFALLLLFVSCETANPEFQGDTADPDYLHRSMQKLTDVIVHDIFSPPVASRNYVYPTIAAYEVMVNGTEGYNSLVGQLRDLEEIPAPKVDKEYCFPVAAIYAFTQAGKSFIFSEKKIEDYQKQLLVEWKAIKVPKDVLDRSLEYGDQVAQHILAWADGDMYKQTRTFPKYSVPEDPSKWQPTPPDYMSGIEPSWNKIRPMILDSAEQFVPPPPTTYDLDRNSKFFNETQEVYLAVKDAGPEETEIAQFWDCNPYVSHHKGHVMFATKKITPGGHWIGITKIATKKLGLDFMQTLEGYTWVSISLFDAFISCWDEKYRSNLVRPETVINQHIDEDWLPLLQTPPFPEHTSGHSVISSAASVALTELYGDNFSFVDSTEVAYGLPPRSFESFYEASAEAAISRLYGGIHYRPAIDYGVDQGKKVGALIVGRMKTKG